MGLEDELIAWAASRPKWQQRIMCWVARGRVMSELDYAALLDEILGVTAPAEECLVTADLAGSPDTALPVRVRSINDLHHVNALSGERPLEVARLGITIVYGDNGSGKSGFARLLKSATRSRHSEEVLSDVFRDTGAERPSASIGISIGASDLDVPWPSERSSAMQQVLFYDANCGRAYADTESDFPYRPFALFVVDGLIAVCTELRRRLDDRLNANNLLARRTPQVPLSLVETELGKLVGSLETASVASLDGLLETNCATSEGIARLREEEVRLQGTSPAAEQARLSRLAQRMDRIARHVEALGLRLEDSASIRDLNDATGKVTALEHAASILVEAFASQSLPGVGSDPWRRMWVAAASYSTDLAYPGSEFPVVADGSRCVLCQQALDEAARVRLAEFRDMAANDIVTRLDAARRDLEARLTTVQALTIRTGLFEADLAEIQEEFAKEASAVKAETQRLEERQKAVVGLIASRQPIPSSPGQWAGVRDRLLERGRELQADSDRLGDPEAVRTLLASAVKARELAEFANAVSDAHDAVAAEIARLQERSHLEEAKAAAATGPMTKKVSDLSEEGITEVIRDTFTREADRLSLERVTLAKTRAERGALLHQPKLVGARQSVGIQRVFSEGERTALGLAAFFTEAQLDVSRSAIILDDPVTSLDHIRRASVATRLCSFAETRQVIVFTHDVSFVADLKREAGARDVTVCERSVTRGRGGDAKPGRCVDNLPWKARDARQRIADLKVDIARMRRDRPTWDCEQYDDEVALWAGKLSETWERIIGQEVVGPVLAEGGTEVRPRAVRRLALFSEADEREFQASYSRASQWAKRHDKSPLTNFVAPEVDRLQDELALVEAWFQRVKGYSG